MVWPLEPMKAATGTLPRGADWMFEPKWDGHRAMVKITKGAVDIRSSSGKPRLESWPWLQSVTDLVEGDMILDGEVIALDGEVGTRHSFQSVGRADRAHAFVVFDLLERSGVSLLATPWHERRRLLEAVLAPAKHIFITPVTDDADALMQATKATGFEGVIAKRLTSTYLPGRRSSSWIKVKHRAQQEVVIGGYLVGEGSRAATFGSILVGVHSGDTLVFCGAVGSGFNEVALRHLIAQFRELETNECPFDPIPALPRGRAVWLRPELVAQVTFGEWTTAGHLRHPVFLGLRDDKAPRVVVREP